MEIADAAGIAAAPLREPDEQMTIGQSKMTSLRPTTLTANGGITTARDGIRRVVLRYLRWRAVSQLRRLDARTLQEPGIHAEDILAVICEAQTERLANKFREKPARRR